MITLNSEQLIFLHSLTESGSLVGLNIPQSSAPDQDRFEKMEKSLHEHGFLRDKQFTDKGLLAMRLIEDYKGSRHHLLINSISIGMNQSEKECTAFDVSTGNLIISRPLKETVWKVLIEQNKALQKQHTHNDFGFVATVCSREFFYNNLETGTALLLFYVKRYKENHLKEDFIYYEENSKIYRFDLMREEKLERDAEHLRSDFLRFLQLERSGLHV